MERVPFDSDAAIAAAAIRLERRSMARLWVPSIS
jgi:hypothetical protein